MTDSFSVIILTFNEEKNIRACLDSLRLLNTKIYIVDSGSTDKTLDICRNYTSNIFHHPFDNYGAQRNWALNNLPVNSNWVLNMDADHRVTTELAEEINITFSQPIAPEINGFLVSRRTMFMGKWIKHGGHYPTYHAILFRKGFGQCEDKLYDQHFIVAGKTKLMNHDMIDIITDSLTTFIARHNHWATLEAKYHAGKLNNDNANECVIEEKFFGTPIERRRYIKKRYESFPLFVRPVIYFMIRYFIRLGFLDGPEGIIFHFLQGFWFRFLIDAKIYETGRVKNETKHSAGRFLVTFFILFLFFYFFNLLYFGITNPGNHYSQFLAANLNYIRGLRWVLLNVSANVINLFGFTAICDNYNLLVAGRGEIQVVYSCLGLGIISFFSAFVLAYPKPLRSKISFLLTGIITIELLNVIRFVILAIFWDKKSNKIIDHHTVFNIIIDFVVIFGIYFWVKFMDNKNKQYEPK